jgi:uncharacterized repeat protein (TIGR03803 family)
MLGGLSIRTLRDTVSAPRIIAMLLLLGLATLSGCHGSAGLPRLMSLQITPTHPSVAVGTSAQLTATGIYSDNSHADVTAQVSWTTSNTAVATVGAGTGKALGVTAGSSTVSVSLQGLTATTTLTVTSTTLVSIAITPSIPSIAAGTSEQFTATGIFSDNTTQNLTPDLTWTSSNAAVATISSSGLASAVASGSTTITATCKVASTCGTLAGSTTLTVKAATLVSIAITPSNPSIALGINETFTATGTYSDNSTQNLTAQVTWNSATPAVATISNSAGTAGVATPVATGATLITAALGGVTSGAVTFTVTPPATLVSIAITPSAPSIALGTSMTLIATGTYSDNSTQNLTTQVTWNSATPAVATISNATGSNGLATSVSTGTTLITAALGSVTSPAITFTVTPVVLVSIAITPVGPSIAVTGAEQFIATGTYSDSSIQLLTGTATWSSSNANIAAVSNAAGSQGLATGLAVGSTSISAALSGVTSPTVTLTVTTQSELVLYSFTGTPDGNGPYAGLIQGTDGNFYGTTQNGGTNNAGTAFKITPAGVETVLWSFGSGTDGQYPGVGLIQGTDGNFYGTTEYGGTSGYGTVFKITPAGVETVLHSFAGGNDGEYPLGALIQASDGNFYGTTQQGGGGVAGANYGGTVFKITPAGVETVLYAFTYGSDGGFAGAALIQGTDGNFYGTTSGAGTYGWGVVFEVTPTGVETPLYSFTGGADGGNSYVALVQGTDGNFYGTTQNGGTNDVGVVFKVTPAGTETVLWTFGSGTDGQNPQAALIQGIDGNFYGTTNGGGTSGSGTIFEVTPAGVETVLYSFTGGNDGGNPWGGLIQGTDGNFYGTTTGGGADGDGTVFKF